MSKALQKIDTRAGKEVARADSRYENWFTKAHKAAIVLASLSAEAAAAIVEDMSDAELRAFAKAFSELKSVSPQLLQAVAEEFLAEVGQEENNLSGGADETRRVLALMADEERVDRILSDVGGGGNSAVWPRIEKIEDQILADYIQAQRMPVAAAIIAKLSHEKTASVLDLAEDDYAQRILLELARKQPPSGEALEAIANVLEEELLKSASVGEEGD